MDVGISAEQELLKDSARRFFEAECPEQHVRDMEEDELGFSPSLWEKMAGLGWHGLMVPESFGGSGLSLLDLTVLVQEAGRALLPAPFVANQIAVAMLLANGSHDQQSRYLPRIVDGSQIHTYAVPDGDGHWQGDEVSLSLLKKGDGRVLSGRKRFVPYGQAADIIWVLARDGENTVACGMRRTAPGVTVTPLKTISGDKQAEVHLDDAEIADEDIVSISDFNSVATPACVLECAWLLGLTERDFEITIDYAKEREQFGKPIGSFQAIQHKAADMVSDLEGMRFITYRAASQASDDQANVSPSLTASIAKAWCSEASRRIVAHGQQIHGGIGFTMEYRIQLYFRRQKRGELFWGDADYHRRIVERSLDV